MEDNTQDQQKIAKLEAEVQALKKQQENIHGRNISFHDFIALLTHKILTPMNSIIGLTNFLKDTQLNQEQKGLVDRIHSNGLSLVEIYNEILDFIQLETIDSNTTNEKFDIEQIIRETIENFYRNTISKKNLEVSTHFQEDLNKYYKGNKSRIEQILLLSLGEPDNTDTQKKITIQVGEENMEEQDAIKLIITHNPSTLENHHIQYLTSDEEKSWEKAINTNNSFFKLLFVKKIIKLINGTLTIQKGDNLIHLHITLPIEHIPSAKTGAFSSGIPEFAGLQSLIVSENIADQNELLRILEHWGIKCFIADSEKDAIEKTIRETQLNFAIISDGLPDIPSKTLARKIKSLPGKSQFPLILLQKRKSILSRGDYFIDAIQSIDNQTHIFEKILKNISEGKITKDPHKLDNKLAVKVPLDILVVEDDQSNLDLLMMLLKKLGYKADTAKDGVKALHAIKAKDYDIILMDIQIPKKSGFQVAKQVLQKNKNKDKNKIIAISANTLQSTKDKASKAGMVDFITKPISFKRIEETIIKWGFAHKLLSNGPKNY